ncbi:13509_t:CDS:2, partial [Racocetra persica]
SIRSAHNTFSVMSGRSRQHQSSLPTQSRQSRQSRQSTQQTSSRQPSPSRQSVQQTYSRQPSLSQPTSHPRSSRRRREAEDRERLFAQNRQIYLLIRQLSDDFQDLRNEMRQRNIQGTQGIQGEDLSAKVWDISIEIYISIVKHLFPRVIYPTQDEIKESLKNYLNEKFSKFIANISANDFANWFHSVWCSQ